MKKAVTIIAVVAMLLTISVPAWAIKYDPSAPRSPIPPAYTRALEMYEVNEAIRLGLVPESLQNNYYSDLTRADIAEAALNFVAAQYGYDLANFLDACAINPPLKRKR